MRKGGTDKRLPHRALKRRIGTSREKTPMPKVSTLYDAAYAFLFLFLFYDIPTCIYTYHDTLMNLSAPTNRHYSLPLHLITIYPPCFLLLSIYV
ncbi:hypothetical protein F5X96DRAFT_629391 [Biscogniauxia mediterranea]|nr:hypothetical protein F5X96DRAFT_629391 [Biscogniauxia mediterranea]